MLDTILVACLVFLIPAHQLWRTQRLRHRPAQSNVRRYVRSIAIAVVLTGLLAVIWVSNHRPVSALGLGLSEGGLLGALSAAVLVAIAYFFSRRSKPSASSAKAEKLLDEMVPSTRAELIVFIAFSLSIGIAWELLYRGYLLWVLTPQIGLVGAILVAAVAYGAAHGYQSHRLFAGSLLAALLMTCGYALTHSLWWLIVIHVSLPMMGALLRYPAVRKAKILQAT